MLFSFTSAYCVCDAFGRIADVFRHADQPAALHELSAARGARVGRGDLAEVAFERVFKVSHARFHFRYAAAVGVSAEDSAHDVRRAAARFGAVMQHALCREDFPDEPLPVDSTISHGIERIYPIAVQDEGYYTAWCSPDAYASLYMNNLSYMMREYNKRLYKIYSLQNWKNMLFTLDRTIKEKRGSIKFKKFKYYKYKILSKITFGTRRKHYKEKYKLFSEMKKKRHPGA